MTPEEWSRTPYDDNTRWRVEVAVRGEDKWATNSKTFASLTEAKEWGDGLIQRRATALFYRVVPAEHPKNETLPVRL